MAGLLRFCHGSSKTVIRPPNFRGERAIKEGAGLGNGGGDRNRVWGQRSQAEAELGDRDRTMLRDGPADRDGGGATEHKTPGENRES